MKDEYIELKEKCEMCGRSFDKDNLISVNLDGEKWSVCINCQEILQEQHSEAQLETWEQSEADAEDLILCQARGE